MYILKLGRYKFFFLISKNLDDKFIIHILQEKKSYKSFVNTFMRTSSHYKNKVKVDVMGSILTV